MSTSRFSPLALSLTLGLGLGLVLATGCVEDTTTGPTRPTDEVEGGKRNISESPLDDRNPNSSSFGDMLTPGQHQGRITAWYFGAAT
jgi:hypothetical protein